VYTMEDLEVEIKRSAHLLPIISRISQNEFGIVTMGAVFNPALPAAASSFFDGRMTDAQYVDMIKEINMAVLQAHVGLTKRFPPSELAPRFSRMVNAATGACAAVNDRFRAQGIPAIVSVSEAGHDQITVNQNKQQHVFRSQLRLVFDDRQREDLKRIEAHLQAVVVPKPSAYHKAEGKKYAFFLSHVKAEAALIATLYFQVLTFELGLAKDDVFFDTENLNNLRHLKLEVKASDVFACMLTKSYLTRPWCLIELYEAIRNEIKIKPILISGGGYEFADAVALLTSTDLQARLNAANPGTYEALVQEGYEPEQVCQVIAQTLPYLMAKPFDPNASLNVKKAQVQDTLGLQ